VVALLLHPAAATAGTSWRPWDAGLREAGGEGRPVLVNVYTDWCGWCRRMEREVYSRRDVQDYLARKFVTVKLNAESNEAARYAGKPYTGRTLAAHFGVTGYPTTIFLTAKGDHLGNVPGYTPPDRFLLLLRYVGDGHMDRGQSFQEFVRSQGAGKAGSVPPPRR
jgi:thioredoxin-related protein